MNSTDVALKPCAKCKANPRSSIKSSWCRDCNAQRMRARRAGDPAKEKLYARELNLQHRYGMSIQDYDDKLAAQNGMCACCGKEPKIDEVFHVDHDHSCCPGKNSCGKCIRDLLCVYCNTVVGKLELNAFMKQEIYLMRWAR